MDPSAATSPDWPVWLEANLARFLLFARAQTRCEADAQDVLQEVLAAAWQRARGRPPDDALVFTIIRRRAIDLGRRIDRRERREQASPDWWQPPAETSIRDAELENAVRALPTPLRDVVLLKTWGRLTFREIAGVLGIPAGTAASRYRYGIDHLRKALEEARS